MDYERKARNVTYFASSCKMYLRHDFRHTCAYCGVTEETLSPFPEVAEKYFEKDHFLPQKDELPERHKYSNLFYACQKCNGKKDAIILPLNPCEDNIYSGDRPHIFGGTSETGFCVKTSTTAGKNYIEALELNSRYHVAIREKKQQYLQANTEARNILDELRKSNKVDEASIKKIETAMYPIITAEDVKYLCGSSEFGLGFVEVYNYLTSRGYNCEIVFESSELDMVLTIGSVRYWVQLLEPSCAKECRVEIEKLRKWKEYSNSCGVLRYIPSEQGLRFYKINFDSVDWSKKLCCIRDYEEL